MTVLQVGSILSNETSGTASRPCCEFNPFILVPTDPTHIGNAYRWNIGTRKILLPVDISSVCTDITVFPPDCSKVIYCFWFWNFHSVLKTSQNCSPHPMNESTQAGNGIICCTPRRAVIYFQPIRHNSNHARQYSGNDIRPMVVKNYWRYGDRSLSRTRCTTDKVIWRER